MSTHPALRVIHQLIENAEEGNLELLHNISDERISPFVHTLEIEAEGLRPYEIEDLHLLFTNLSISDHLTCISFVRSEEFKWTLFQFKSKIDIGVSIIMSAAGANEGAALPMRHWRHSSLIPHTTTFRLSHHNKRQTDAIIYSHFVTFDSFIKAFTGTGEAHRDMMKKVIRDYVILLEELHESETLNGQIEALTLVVVGGRGKFLCPSKDMNLSNISRLWDFRNLGIALKNVCGPYFEYGDMPNGLNVLLNHLKDNMNSAESVQWLHHAPFILKPEDIVRKFIPIMSDLADQNSKFRGALTSITVYWVDKVENGNFANPKCPEVFSVFDHRSTPTSDRFAWKDNGYHFLKMLRNEVEHMNDYVKKTPVTTRVNEGTRQKYITHWGTKRKEFSTLLLNPQMFIDCINDISSTFLDDVFEIATSYPCLLEALDQRPLYFKHKN